MKTWHLPSSFALLLVLGVAFGQAQDGAQLYQQHCAVCHGDEGQGTVGPPFAGNAALADANLVVRQVLYGGQQMPPFGGTLDDAQVATVATHIRSSWGNAFGALSAEQVAKVRAGETLAITAPAADRAQAQATSRAGDQPSGQNASDGQASDGGAAASAQAAADAAGSRAEDLTVASSGPPRLVDGNGLTLYRFRFDAPSGTSHCYDPCVNRWLPVIVSGPAQPGSGVTATELGTVERDDGTMQATFRGWPLYRFKGDMRPGDVQGDVLSDVWTSIPLDIEAIAGP